MRVNVNARFSVLLYIRVDRTQDKVEKISKCNESEWKMNVKSTINLYDEFRIDIPEFDRQMALPWHLSNCQKSLWTTQFRSQSYFDLFSTQSTIILLQFWTQ